MQLSFVPPSNFYVPQPISITNLLFTIFNYVNNWTSLYILCSPPTYFLTLKSLCFLSRKILCELQKIRVHRVFQLLTLRALCGLIFPVFYTTPLIMPASFGPLYGIRLVSFTPALANISLICVSE